MRFSYPIKRIALLGVMVILSGCAIEEKFNITYFQTYNKFSDRLMLITLGRSSSYALHANDLLSGIYWKVASLDGLQFPDIQYPSGVAMAADNLAIVSDNFTKTIYEIDLVNRTQRIVTNPTTGTGPEGSTIVDFVYDDANGQIIVVTNEGPDFYLVSVDLATGDRAILSGLTTGTGPSFGYIADVTLVGDKIVVMHNTTNPSTSAPELEFLSIDPITGNRSSLATTAFKSPAAFAMTSDELSIVMVTVDEIGRLDLNNNAFTPLVGPLTLEAPAYSSGYVSENGTPIPITGFTSGIVLTSDNTVYVQTARTDAGGYTDNFLHRVNLGNGTLSLHDWRRFNRHKDTVPNRLQDRVDAFKAYLTILMDIL